MLVSFPSQKRKKKKKKVLVSFVGRLIYLQQCVNSKNTTKLLKVKKSVDGNYPKNTFVSMLCYSYWQSI